MSKFNRGDELMIIAQSYDRRLYGAAVQQYDKVVYEYASQHYADDVNIVTKDGDHQIVQRCTVVRYPTTELEKAIYGL